LDRDASKDSRNEVHPQRQEEAWYAEKEYQKRLARTRHDKWFAEHNALDVDPQDVDPQDVDPQDVDPQESDVEM
jgi:hypothetical protein